MHSLTIPCPQQLVKYLTFILLVLLMVEISMGIPSSPKLVENKLFAHMIKTRSLSQKYCGRHIVKMLSMLCDGNYFSPSKRNHLNEDNKPEGLNNGLNNGITAFWDDMTPKGDYIKPEDSSEEYFLEPKDAFNMFGGQPSSGHHFNRNRRGIVDECCKKPCNINELLSYCE